MARGKPIVTRTFAPIHFEDLNPHRFEDLIRELIYDFRDWQSIEATGRAESDDGFDILIVDPTGDARHKHPHLYAEFTGPSGPYSGFYARLSAGGEEIGLDESWHRVDFFPKTFSSSAAKPRIHQNEKVNLVPEVLKGFRDYGPLDTLYAVDDRFDFLRQRDIIAVADSARQAGAFERFLQILHIQKGPFVEYLRDHHEPFSIRHDAQRQIGREIADEEQVTILEVETTHVRD